MRKEEILLTKQRDRLFKKIEQISTDKQKIFQQGATQKSPELRKALAQDFELKTQEQLMSAGAKPAQQGTHDRQPLRMVKENNRSRPRMGRLNLTGKDVEKISQWIEDDSVGQDMYMERLNQILDLGVQSDKDAMAQAGVSGAGQELLNSGTKWTAARSNRKKLLRKPTKPFDGKTRRWKKSSRGPFVSPVVRRSSELLRRAGTLRHSSDYFRTRLGVLKLSSITFGRNCVNCRICANTLL